MRHDQRLLSGASSSSREELLKICKQKSAQQLERQRRGCSGKVSLIAIVHELEPEQQVASWQASLAAPAVELEEQGVRTAGGDGATAARGRKKEGGKKRSKLARLFSRSNNNDGGALSSTASESLELEQLNNAGTQRTPETARERAREPQQVGADAELGQVIEFKFDLIVDSSLAAAALDQRKLRDQVNELVESLVFDSNDVCLMSVGGARRAAAGCGRGSSAPSEDDDHIFQLAEIGFSYALELLCAATNCERMSKKAGDFFATGGAPSEKVAHEHEQEQQKEPDYELELGATLFLAAKAPSGESKPPTQPGASSLRCIDLLASAPEVAGAKRSAARATSANGSAQSGRVCGSLERALECLGEIRANAAEARLGELDEQLLLITLKLTQGLFSNCMCLLRLLRPQTSALKPMLECVFSGQALAQLRRHAHHLEALEREEAEELAAEGRQPLHRSATSTAQSSSTLASVNSEALSDLLRAEWLLYKQLSSVLIRTLVLVHVQKLRAVSSVGAPGSASLDEPQQRSRTRSMLDDNLSLLRFARDVQRASARRLKRRQRHLARTREHLLMQAHESAEARSLSAARLTLDEYSCWPSALELSSAAAAAADSISSQAPGQVQSSDLVVSANKRVWQRASGCDLSVQASCACCQGQHHQRRRRRFGQHGDQQQQRLSSLDRRWPRNVDQSASSCNEPRSGRSRPHNRCRRACQAGAQVGQAQHEACQPAWRLDSREQTRQRCQTSSLSTRSDSLALTESSSLASTGTESSATSKAVGASKSSADTSGALAALMAAASARQRRSSLTRNQSANSSTLVLDRAPQLLLGASDTEDSLASAYLLSSGASSATGHALSASRLASRRDLELRWRAKQQIRRQDLLSGAESSESSNNNNNNNTSNLYLESYQSAKRNNSCLLQVQSPQRDLFDDDATNSELDLTLDLAEPPRQLKLEQFLNQLNTIIQIVPKNEPGLPSSANERQTSSVRLCELNSQAAEFCLDDDEDCKSHSSVLEHLSSLAFESKQKQQQQQRCQQAQVDQVR